MNASTSTPIIVRKLGTTPAIFLLNTLNLDRNVIDVWDGGNTQPRTVTLDHYRNSKPLRDEETDMWAEKFRERFLPHGSVMIRSRIAKDLAKAQEEHAKRAQEPAKHNVLESAENKAAQQRESAPQPEQQAQQHSPMGDIDKVMLVERITHAFATSFAKSMAEAMKEVLK